LLGHIVLQGWCPESIDHLILFILLSGGGGLSDLLSKRRHHTVVIAIVACGQRTLKLRIGVSMVDY
jgi:hypothetical protein